MTRLCLSSFILLCTLMFAAPAATTTPERQSGYSLIDVISLSGGFVCGNPDYDLLFTMGEPAVGASLSADSLLLWSGFVPFRCTCALCPGITGIGTPRPSRPQGMHLYLAGPNPSTQMVRMLCELPDGAIARLAVYDALGRRVRLLHEGPFPSSPHEIRWDGYNSSGTRVPAGVYYARLTSGSIVVTERFVIVR